MVRGAGAASARAPRLLSQFLGTAGISGSGSRRYRLPYISTEPAQPVLAVRFVVQRRILYGRVSQDLANKLIADSLQVLVRGAIEQTGGKARAAFYLADDSGRTLHHITGMPKAYANCVDGFAIGPESLAC